MQVNRDLKQIAAACADTDTGSEFSPKRDTAHVCWLHPVIA